MSIKKNLLRSGIALISSLALVSCGDPETATSIIQKNSTHHFTIKNNDARTAIVKVVIAKANKTVDTILIDTIKNATYSDTLTLATGDEFSYYVSGTGLATTQAPFKTLAATDSLYLQSNVTFNDSEQKWDMVNLGRN